ncbi:hypothetical protein [Rosistilla oblonga]|uniref:Uncharacterized protein n=1 Tax=Rosistilla oblonga TaxID=2527990 RepID=A0A518ITH8_9BACT|nr:hypothetical protein [Rosistilla oblonga]QDV56391.1 hypothetical protein Mal33_23810 [Rosistilla oblonga]
MSKYPTRPRFFAHRFVRLLAKSGAANELGVNVCWMLTTIAMLEDSKRYRSHVTFYNEQLMGLCAFGGRKRLVEARDRAVAAGWLHYEQGGKSIPGKYWVLIPSHFEEIEDSGFDDSDVCRSETEQETVCRSDLIAQPEQQGDSNRNSKGTLSGAPSLPIPAPNPITVETSSTTKEKPRSQAKQSGRDCPMFQAFYAAYPRHIKPEAAAKAFASVAKKIAKKSGGDVTAAQKFLIDRAKAFAKSDSGQAGKFCPHPSTWLNAGDYDTDPAEWSATNGTPQRHETFDPSDAI